MGLARRSYVVRCLPVRGEEDEELVWRFSIQEAEAEAVRHAFRSLDDLVAFLRADLGRPPPAAGPTGDGPGSMPLSATGG